MGGVTLPGFGIEFQTAGGEQPVRIIGIATGIACSIQGDARWINDFDIFRHAFFLINSEVARIVDDAVFMRQIVTGIAAP